MKMEDLRRHADDSIWHDGEQTRHEYIHPIARSPWRAGLWSLRSWKKLAEQHIVDRQNAPHTLVAGIPAEELYELDGFWCAKSSESHLSCFLHAIDFLVPDGAVVRAAHNGVIVELVEVFDEWGDQKDEHGEWIHRDHLNYMTIRAGEEYMQYCHIAKRSVSRLGLRVGSHVVEGQPIARVGKNGVTDRDHLHFIVLRMDRRGKNPFGFKSLVPRFRR